MLPSCGKNLVDSEFQGDAVFHVDQFVLSYTNGTEADDFEHPTYAMFWMPGGIHGTSCDLHEQPNSSRPFTQAKDGFNLFSLPDDDLLAKSPGGAAYGFARIIPYDDLNQNGKLDGNERLIGDTVHAIIYAPERLSAKQSPVGLALSKGFHVSTGLPIPCDAPQRGQDDCDVNLGAACFGSSVCGDDGECMHPDLGWANGYCVLPATVGGCSPQGAALYLDNGPNKARFWIAGCTKNADCRTDEGYFCDQLIGGCVPDEALPVVVGRASPDKLCVDWTVTSLGGAPSDCVPPDPRCDGIPGGGEAPSDRSEPNQTDGGMPPRPDDDGEGPGPMPPRPDDGGMPPGGGGNPPSDCVPPDPRCDGIPGGGEDASGGDKPPPDDCVPPDPRCDGIPGGGEMPGPDGKMPPAQDGDRGLDAAAPAQDPSTDGLGDEADELGICLVE